MNKFSSQKSKHTVYIAMGSNRGPSMKLFQRALKLIERLPSTTIEQLSSIYSSSPLGGPKQKEFLNGVIKIKTSIPPKGLINILLHIETKLGRKRTIHWGPRTIDLDIIAIGQMRIDSSSLTVPHSQYHKRKFVLIPFCEIAPRYRHPILKKTNLTILRQLTAHDQRVTILRRWKK